MAALETENMKWPITIPMDLVMQRPEVLLQVTFAPSVAHAGRYKQKGAIMKKLVLLTTVFIPNIVVSATLSGVQIDKLNLNLGLGSKVFIRTSVSPQEQARIGCHTDNNWNFVLPLENNLDTSIYSSLLAALASGKTVTLVGTNNCNENSGYPTIETLRNFTIQK